MKELKQLEKTNLSYLMLKPDSKENVGHIFDELSQHSYDVVKIYHLECFKENAIIAYSNKKYDKDYYQSIRAHLFLSSFYFGNQGLLLIVDINDDSSLEVFKKHIRNKYSLGENNASQMLINLSVLSDFDRDIQKGTLCVANEEKNYDIPFYKTLYGKWGVTTLNMLHAPDNYGEYLKDIHGFYDGGIISDENAVNGEELSLIKKYKSYERVK